MSEQLLPVDVLALREEELAQEIRTGLQEALAQATDREAIASTLAARRLERLTERYTELATSEPLFMKVVDRPIDWKNIDPVLQWVKTDAEQEIWNYARNLVSSMPENSVIGRQMRYYFLDRNSGRWLGIVCLASALTGPSPRYYHLKWSQETKWQQLCHVMNIAVCIPIQPFGQLLGGKLLFVSALSNEVRTAYQEQYGDALLAIETTSLYGKSSQYNRVKEYQYLGLTKGDGNIHVSEPLWRKIVQFTELRPEYAEKKTGSNIKPRTIAKVGRAVGVKDGSMNGQQRGFYWGVTAENAESILRGADEEPRFYDRPMTELTDSWRRRWYEMRLPKKIDEAKQFDPSIYLLDNNVPPENRTARQMFLF